MRRSWASLRRFILRSSFSLFREKKEKPQSFEGLLPESPGQNLVLTVLSVPNSGWNLFEKELGLVGALHLAQLFQPLPRSRKLSATTKVVTTTKVITEREREREREGGRERARERERGRMRGREGERGRERERCAALSAVAARSQVVCQKLSQHESCRAIAKSGRPLNS